jgi:hypothetical protein
MRMNLLKFLRNQKLAMSISIFVVFYFLICVPYAVAIETASLNFSPSQNEARAGKVLNIKVTLNTGGQAVNAVQADISYPLSIFDPNKSKVNCIEAFPTRATDSKNILGNVGVADITVISNNNTYSTLDINNDTEIDSKDLAALITDFGKESSKSDVNKDKIVNTIDLSILLSNQF